MAIYINPIIKKDILNMLGEFDLIGDTCNCFETFSGMPENINDLIFDDVISKAYLRVISGLDTYDSFKCVLDRTNNASSSILLCIEQLNILIDNFSGYDRCLEFLKGCTLDDDKQKMICAYTDYLKSKVKLYNIMLKYRLANMPQ
jgi:hypothetical protein